MNKEVYKKEVNKKQVYIEYNPYTVETTILVDGNTPNRDSSLNKNNKILQSWIEKLPQIIYEEYNVKSFSIKFHGHLIDLEDIIEVAEMANADGYDIDVTHIPCRMDNKKAYKNIIKLFETMKNGPVADFKTPEFEKEFAAIINNNFDIAVFATMSSGKSTLINSLIGKELLPSMNEACTATITKVIDTECDTAYMNVYDSDNKLVFSSDNANLEDMRKYNSDESSSEIDLFCNIPFADRNELLLVLTDTPGPNNSRNEQHGVTTRSMLRKSKKNIILFVFNSLSLMANDEAILLNEIKNTMDTDDRQVKDRFIFVVNKLDRFTGDNDDVLTTIENVKKILTKNYGIENPKVFPASALVSLYTRIDVTNNIKRVLEKDSLIKLFNQIDDFYLEKYAPLTSREKDEINQRLQAAIERGDENEIALIHSGIPSLESTISTYLSKYALTEKIRDATGILSYYINSCINYDEAKQLLANATVEKDLYSEKLKSVKAKITNDSFNEKIEKQLSKLKFDKEIDSLATKLSYDVTNEIFKMAKMPIYSKIENNCNCMISEKEYNSTILPIFKMAEKSEEDMLITLNEELVSMQAKMQSSCDNIFNKEILKILDDDFEGCEIKVSTPKMNGKIYFKSGFDESKLKESKLEDIYEDQEKKRYYHRKFIWYKPKTWFKRKGYYIEKCKVKVGEEIVTKYDLKQIKKTLVEYEKSITRNSMDAVNEAVRVYDDYLEKYRSLMYKNQKMVSEKLDEYSKALYASEEELAEIQKSVDWMKSVKQQLKSIIEL